MSYTECLKALREIESDTEADERYTRMRLAEVYGCILCSSLTTEQCNHLIDILHRVGSRVGLPISRLTNIFYEYDW